jgi:hypothetical protein
MRYFPKLLRSQTSQAFETTDPYSRSRDQYSREPYSRGSRSHGRDEELGSDKDISLRVLVTGGNTPSIGDTESQKAILGEDGIFVRSEVHVEQKSGRQDGH